MTDQKWTILTQAAYDLEAQILRGMLEAQGIPVVLSAEGYGKAIGQVLPVDILVPNETLDRARKLMEEYYSGEPVESPEDEELDPQG